MIGGAVTVLLSAYLVVVSYKALPFLDGWTEIDFGANEGGRFLLDWLWRQESQHRQVIPKLFLLADLRWFHATQVFLLIGIFTIQVLHLLLLCWSMRTFGGWKGGLQRTGAGLAAFCLFCPSQWENFTWGFQTCFVLPGLFATLSFIGLLMYWKSGHRGDIGSRWKYLLMSIVAAVGASYSLSNGNLLWPLLVAAALILRLPLKATLGYIIACSVSTALYLNNYTVYPSTSSSAKAPITVIKYVAVYFGSSWIPKNVRLAEFVGLVGLVVVVCVLLLLPSYIRDSRPLALQLVLTMMFCLGTGLITALGRLPYGIGQAFSSRYQTIALLFWCCLGLLLLGHVSWGRMMRGSGLLLSQAVLLAVMIVAAFLARTPISDARLLGFQVNAAAMALITDVPDWGQLQWIDTRPQYVRSLVPYMREERLSVFSGKLPSLLGQQFGLAFNLPPPPRMHGGSAIDYCNR